MMSRLKHSAANCKIRDTLMLLLLLMVFGWRAKMPSLRRESWPEVMFIAMLSGPALSQSPRPARSEAGDQELQVLSAAGANPRGRSNILLWVGIGGACAAGGYAIGALRQKPANPPSRNLELSKALDRAEIGIAVLGLQRKVLFCNSFFRKLYGFEKEELIGRSLPLPESRLKEWEALEEGLRMRKPFCNVRTLRLHKDGTSFSACISGAPLFDSSGAFCGVVGVVAEATNSGDADVRGWSMRLLADASSDFLLLLDPNLNVVYANPTLTANLAMRHDEICGKAVLDYFIAEDRERAREFFGTIMNSGLDLDHQAPVLRMGRGSEGHPIPLLFNAYAIRNSVHLPASIACIGRNRSFEMLLSKQLRQSRQEIEALLGNTSAAIVKVKTDGMLFECNKRFEEMTGYSADEVKRMRFASFVHPEDLETGRERFLRLAAGEIDRYEVDKRLVDRQGNVIWTRMRVSLIRSEKGEPSHTVSVIEPLTDQAS
jgi:PAS domain S-box-containing protein